MEIIDTNKVLTYSSYLQLNRLLSLQKLQSDDQHDEMLFVVIHQTYELWFKQITHELNFFITSLQCNSMSQMFRTLKRIRHIMKLIVQQVDVLETMSPQSFASFRTKLGSASGFQSEQFHHIEKMLGITRALPTTCFIEITGKTDLWSEFLKCYLNFFKAEEICLYNDMGEIESLLMSLYEHQSLYTEIAEMLLDLDEGIQEWRYRHVKLVERIIGCDVMGTGGSSGFEYLKRSLSKSFCPQLWKIRNLIFNKNSISEY